MKDKLSSSKRGEHYDKRKDDIMKKERNEIKRLKYQIERYQAMGNGAMCQTLQSRLNQLMQN